MFGRRKKHQPEVPRSGASGGDADEGLRGLILNLDPSSAGIAPTVDYPVVWGALMEVENSLEDFLPDQDSAVPDAGQVTLRALTFGGAGPRRRPKTTSARIAIRCPAYSTLVSPC